MIGKLLLSAWVIVTCWVPTEAPHQLRTELDEIWHNESGRWFD